MSTLLCTVNW